MPSRREEGTTSKQQHTRTSLESHAVPRQTLVHPRRVTLLMPRLRQQLSRFQNILSISSGMSQQVFFSQKQSKTKRSAKTTTKQCYPYSNKKKSAYHAAAKPIKKWKKKINLFVVSSPVQLPGMLQ